MRSFLGKFHIDRKLSFSEIKQDTSSRPDATALFLTLNTHWGGRVRMQVYIRCSLRLR